MNCLLLLIILFCSGSNSICSGNCNGSGSINSCNSGCNTGSNRPCGRNCNTGYNVVREVREEQIMRRECDCDMSHNNHTCQTPTPRTQFPYLEVEPRTCGCEEKNNS